MSGSTATGGHIVPSAFIPGSHQAAAVGLVDFDTVNSYAFKERAIRADVGEIDPDMRAIGKAMCREFTRRGWPMFANCYVRGEADQEAAFKAGHSKARFGQSPHNFGMAVDIVHFGRWWNLTPKEWDVIGIVGKEIVRRGWNSHGTHHVPRVAWGGDWRFYDPAHWELADWKARVGAQPQPLVTFGQAFAHARKAGKATFEWQGERYTTELAD